MVHCGDRLFRFQDTCGIPTEACSFRHGAQRYATADEMLCSVPLALLPEVKVLPRGLKGGKGGFGANLKSAGRQKSGASFDFSACRDLNGRRLRAVNDAQRVAAWKSPKEVSKRARLGAHYQEPSGDLGVSGWHLAVPNWADSFGPKTVKRLQAAADRKEKRLIQAQEEAAAEAEAAKEERLRKIEEYTSSASGIVPQAVMLEAIQAGLSRREKRPRSPPSSGVQGGKTTAVMPTAADAADIGVSPAHWCRVLGPSSQISLQYLQAEPGANAAAAAAGSSSHADAGSSGSDVPTLPVIAEVEALVPFVTVGVPGATAGSGSWHFEVKAASGGVTQIGWMAPSALDGDDSDADTSLGAAAAAARGGGAQPGDGVGDVAASWAWDGSRGTVFEAGTERTGATSWSAGDIVGCSLVWAASGSSCEITWSLNGAPVERVSIASPSEDEPLSLMPALSLEQGEAVQVNVGHSGFAAAFPSGCVPVAAALSGMGHLAPTPAEAHATSIHSGTVIHGDQAVPDVACVVKGGSVAAAGGGAGAATSVTSQLQLRGLSAAEVAAACASLSLEQLKVECLLRGLKCSGTAQQRTARLVAAAAHVSSNGATPVPHKLRAVDFEELFGRAADQA